MCPKDENVRSFLSCYENTLTDLARIKRRLRGPALACRQLDGICAPALDEIQRFVTNCSDFASV